jgi:hypothetical protein
MSTTIPIRTPTFEQRKADHTPATARLAGLAYLGLLICGAVGYLWIRGEIYVAGNAVDTAANLTEHEGMARIGVAAEAGAALMQALVAVAFFMLFRHIHAVAAGCVAAFGLVGSAALMLAATFSATALHTALDGSASSADNALLMYDLNDSAWVVGGLFFGLWLIPMGWLVLRSAYMPRLIGWLLLAGGVGYVLSTFVTIGLPDATAAADILLMPSTIGELWMIGYLLVKGVRTRRQ